MLPRGEPSPGSRGPAARGIRLVAFRVAVLAAVLCVIPLWLRAVRLTAMDIRSGGKTPLGVLVGEERHPGFMEAVDEVRNLVPPDGSYLLLTDPYGSGALTSIALRHALLPRKPVLMQRFKELPVRPSVPLLATVVIENDEDPPAVVAGAGLLDPFDPAPFGVEDGQLPGSVEEVAFEPTGRIGVRGWCQEAAGVPCEIGAVLLDGTSVPFSRPEREPRPDVESAVSSLAPCPRAGYRLTIPRSVVPGERVRVEVVFRSSDGRWRTYPESVVARTR